MLPLFRHRLDVTTVRKMITGDDAATRLHGQGLSEVQCGPFYCLLGVGGPLATSLPLLAWAPWLAAVERSCTGRTSAGRRRQYSMKAQLSSLIEGGLWSSAGGSEASRATALSSAQLPPSPRLGVMAWAASPG